MRTVSGFSESSTRLNCPDRYGKSAFPDLENMPMPAYIPPKRRGKAISPGVPGRLFMQLSFSGVFPQESMRAMLPDPSEIQASRWY
jgi:hypothetical protein